MHDQALSEALSHKVMRQARAQQDELDAEDLPDGALPKVCILYKAWSISKSSVQLLSKTC